MWTKAASLASIERSSGLPDAFTVRVDFRKPLLLPSRVRFAHQSDDFALYDENRTLTHLVGRITPG